MKRLIKTASDDDDMSFDEVKEETIKALENMKKNNNEWGVRDTLTKLTKLDIYDGDAVDSVSEKDADKICDRFINVVKNMQEDSLDTLCEINEKVCRFAYIL